MNPEPTLQTNSPEEETPEATLHEQVYPLYVMLPIFGVIALMALSSELTSDRKLYKYTDGVQAAVPHSPAEFDDILEGFDPLPPPVTAENPGHLFPTPSPPLSEDIFPCSECHDSEDLDPDDREQRKLELEHENIVLDHDEENRWCLSCHDFEDRDMLRLAGGKKIPFEESYKLCGQCHGTIYRDWRAGIHGKRTGFWNGRKRYVLCVHCHWPHAPHFKPLKPLPPPTRPQFLHPKKLRPVASPSKEH